MNKGFAVYFGKAMKSSGKSLWKSKSFLQMLMYFLIGIVAKVTVLFSALFALADVRQAKIADENKRFDIPQTMQVATKSKPVWTMVLSIIAEAFICLGGVLLIAALTCILGLIGYAVWHLLGGPVWNGQIPAWLAQLSPFIPQAVAWLAVGPRYMIALFSIPGALILLVYAVIMCLIFSPTPYVIETNPDFGVSETIKACYDTMKSRGKGTVFMNVLVPFILSGIIVGFCVTGHYLLPQLLAGTSVGKYASVIMVAWYIFSLALMLLLLPYFDLVHKVAQKKLFEDIVEDCHTRMNGINIQACKGVKFERGEIQSKLVSLFDETETDSVPAPDSPARKKLKEKAEKAARNREIEAGRPKEPKRAKVEKEAPVAAPAAVQPAAPVETPAAPAAEEAAAPVVEETAAPAVEEAAAPVVEETATPVVEESAAPVVEEAAAPAVEEAAPVEEEPAAPAAEEAAPVEEEPAAPAAEEAAPVEEEPAVPANPSDDFLDE